MRNTYEVIPKEKIDGPWNTPPLDFLCTEKIICRNCEYWGKYYGDYAECTLQKEVLYSPMQATTNITTKETFGCNEWKKRGT